MCSAASAWLAKLMSITAAGWPSAAARLTSRPSASRKISRPSLVRWPSTNGRAWNFSTVIASRSLLVDLDVEVARVADDRAGLHRLEHLAGDRVAVAGHRDEHVADPGRLDARASPRTRP